MIKNFDLCRLVSSLCEEHGWGAFVAIYNDIEGTWSYMIGQFKEKNPSNLTHYSTMSGIDVTHLFVNSSMYFSGDMMDKEKVMTYVKKCKEEKKVDISFDFRFVRF